MKKTFSNSVISKQKTEKKIVYKFYILSNLGDVKNEGKRRKISKSLMK
jgi:hypothetical protein